MKFAQVEVFALIASIASAQTLDIPTRVGSVTALPSPSIITGDVDLGNREFDRGHPCNSDEDTGDENAVFILEDGASLSNVIIGADSLEGVHCKGACTLKNVWFRDVCEDAISILGPGDALIIGGGAQEAKDKVVQHNNIGTVTIKDYTVVNAGKLYRSCGDCSNNEAKSPRHVIIDNVRAYGMTSDLVGINSNFGDTATISNSCGTTKKVCSEYKGVSNHDGDSEKQTTNDSCGGTQGQLLDLPTCDAFTPAPSSVAAPAITAKTTTMKTTPAATSVVAVTSEKVESTKIITYKVKSTKAVTSVKATSTAYSVSAKATPAKPTTLITRTKSSKAAAATATKEPCAPKYGRCGGIGYSGATSCPEGSKCVVMNPYFSQCV